MRLFAMAFLALAAAAQDRATVTEPPPEAALGGTLLGAPLSHENLTIYFLEDPRAKSLGDWITLEEGLRGGKLRVSENRPARVNELLVQNGSTQPCFLQAGDVVKGGQQDRAIGADAVVPPRSGRVPVRTFCVEQGRWSSGASGFGTTTGMVVGARLRAAIQNDKDQSKVWAAVEKAKADLVQANALRASSSTSLNEQLLDRKVRERLDGFLTALGKACEKRERAVGLVTAINGKPAVADLYADPGLFRKLYPRLLAAAAIEAMSVPPKASKAPSPAELAKLLRSADAKSGKGAPLQFRFRHGDVELHRQVLLH